MLLAFFFLLLLEFISENTNDKRLNEAVVYIGHGFRDRVYYCFIQRRKSYDYFN